MNLFASSMILSHVALEEFLDWPSERREQIFGPLIGVDRIVQISVCRGELFLILIIFQVQFNKLLATRAEVVQLPSSSPVSTSFDTLENEMDGQYYL